MSYTSLHWLGLRSLFLSCCNKISLSPSSAGVAVLAPIEGISNIHKAYPVNKQGSLHFAPVSKTFAPRAASGIEFNTKWYRRWERVSGWRVIEKLRGCAVQAVVLLRVREKICPYPKETPSCLLTCARYSLGPGSDAITRMNFYISLLRTK